MAFPDDSFATVSARGMSESGPQANICCKKKSLFSTPYLLCMGLFSLFFIRTPKKLTRPGGQPGGSVRQGVDEAPVPDSGYLIRMPVGRWLIDSGSNRVRGNQAEDYSGGNTAP
jgi:hypothetical protein